MQTEIEAKFLNIDHDEIRAKLKDLGAKCVHSVRLMRRRNFDFPDGRLEKIAGWVRLRDEGDRLTMSYKQLNDRTLHGTKEVSLTVDNLEQAEAFLRALGLVESSYQETKRESWQLDGVSIELDEWPWIPTFIEIEADNEVLLRSVAEKLSLDFKDAVHGSVENAYQDVFDVTEAEVDHMDRIVFGPVPEWLEKRRNK